MAFYDSPAVVLGLRIAQGLLAIIVLGLTGYIADWWSGFWNGGSPSSVNFLLFCSVWTLLVLIFLIIVPWRFASTKANHGYAILGVEAVTMIFWFAGFIALAVIIGGPCRGSICSSAQAAAVFGAFEWLLFAATTALAALHLTRSRSSSSKSDPNLRVQQAV